MNKRDFEELVTNVKQPGKIRREAPWAGLFSCFDVQVVARAFERAGAGTKLE